MIAGRTAIAGTVALALAAAGCSRHTVRADEDPNAPAARIGGQVITNRELSQEARPALVAVEARYAEEIHGAKARALEALIEKRLLAAKAKSEGLTVETLVAREVVARVPEPTEGYLRAVYDQTKASGKVVPPFPESKADITRFVKEQTFQSMRQAYVAKLRSEAKVQVLLPPVIPPKVEVNANGPSKGDPKAPVTIVEFADYECQFCAAAEPAIREVLAAYGAKVRFVFQSFPLSIHPNALAASEAALCAGEQGRYWEMHEKLWASQQALRPEDLKAHARALGLDGARFDGCLDSARTAAAVESSRKIGEALGLSSTPTFFVNGRALTGAQPVERLRELVDHELQEPRR